MWPWRGKMPTKILVEALTVDDADADEDRAGNSLLQIWKLRFGQKAELLFRLWVQGLVKNLNVEVQARFEAGVWSVFWCWCFVEVMKLNLGQNSEKFFSWDASVCWCRNFEVGAWSIFWRWNLIKVCDVTKISYSGKPISTLGSIVPLAMFLISNHPIADIYEFIPFINDLIALCPHEKISPWTSEVVCC